MTYVKPWKDQSYEDTNTLHVRPELYESVNTTTGSDTQLGMSLDAVDIFYTDMTTRMTYWCNTLRLLRQAKPIAAYIIATEPHKPAEINAWMDTPRISCPERFTTVNIDKEDFYKQITQYWQRCKILDQFTVLAQREDNWDGYGSKKPTQLTLYHAKHFLVEDLFDSIISAGYSWLTPFISSDEDGNVTAEWYEDERQLHIQIGENKVEYIQVWGTNIDTEMHVDFLDRDNYQTLWKWLIDG